MNAPQRLIQPPTRLLDEWSLLTNLKTSRFGRQVRIVARTDSTQNEAAAWARRGVEEGAVVIAEEQTQGRGLQGKSWHSPPGKGIWMSLVLRPPISIPFTSCLTLLFAVALCRAMKRVTGIKLGIKWPNDIWIGNKKVCGILLECAMENERIVHIIAGIGISVNLDENDFPCELREIATSLKIASGKEVDRALLIAECLIEIELLYNLYREQGFSPIRVLWEAQSMMLGRHLTITTPSAKVAGIAQGLDESGALILLGDDGTCHKICTGNVNFTE